MDFEKKLAKLEEISKKMRNDELSLDDSIKSFEEGMVLANELEKELNSFEKRVQILTDDNQLEEFK